MIAVIAAAVLVTAATAGFIMTMLAYAQNITIDNITVSLPQDFMEQIIEEARKSGEVDRVADCGVTNSSINAQEVLECVDQSKR